MKHSCDNEESDVERGDTNGNHLAHLALRKQIVKQNETITLLEERRESLIKCSRKPSERREEVAKNKRSGHDSSSDNGEQVSALVASNEEMSKRCDALEKKYALAKGVQRSSRTRKPRQLVAWTTAWIATGCRGVVEEGKQRDETSNAQTQRSLRRLCEKFVSGPKSVFDKVRDATEMKFDLQALERKRQVEKKLFWRR